MERKGLVIVSGAPESLRKAFRKVMGAAPAHIGEGRMEIGNLRRWQVELREMKPSLAIQVRLGKGSGSKADLALAGVYRKAEVKAVFVYNEPAAVPASLPKKAVVVVAPALYGLWDREEEDAALPLLRYLQQEMLSGRTVPRLTEEAGQRIWPLLQAEDLARAVAAAAQASFTGRPLLVKGAEASLQAVLEHGGWATGCKLGERSEAPLQVPLKGLETEMEGALTLSGGAVLPLGLCFFHLLQRVEKAPLRISACWITKNAAEDLPYSMASVKEAADELIVVDTGSTDETVKVAGEYTDRIYSYPWRDDFAAARNFALSKASGHWIIFLDADEYFLPEGSGALRRILEQAWDSPLPLGLVSPMWDVKRGEEDNHLSRLTVQRIYRRLPGRRYQGAVHEVLSGVPFNVEPVDAPPVLTLYHTGYSPERLEEKAKRNARLLQAEAEAGHQSDLQHYYLSGLALQRKDYREAIKEAKASLAAGERAAYHGFAVYHNWYLAAEALGEPVEEILSAGIAAWPDMPDFHAVKGLKLLSEGSRQEAIRELELAADLADRHDELLPHEENRLADSGEIEKIYRLLGEIYEEDGDKEKAEAWRGRVKGN